jgi:glycosyltransferase involved in cell wall biosynthesis
MASKKPSLSICIPTFNRAALLGSMLRSLGEALEMAEGLDYEIVIRDNGSTDGTRGVIDDFRSTHRVRYFCNSSNLGAVKNVLLAPEKATGDFIWLLGDDDLVVPDAICRIRDAIWRYSELEGVVACHSIAPQADRQRIEDLIQCGEVAEGLGRPLIRKGTESGYLRTFETALSLADIPVPFNFLSNVLVRREGWGALAPKYLKHSETHEDFSDTMTAGPLRLWIEFLAGKPVGLIADPVVVGFVGAQPFLCSWPAMKFGIFLDMGMVLREFGVSEDLARGFERSIYRRGAEMGPLALSRDAYVRTHFSLGKMVRRYGDDMELWSAFLEALHGLDSSRDKLLFLRGILLATLLLPSRWGMCIRLFIDLCRHQSWRVM